MSGGEMTDIHVGLGLYTDTHTDIQSVRVVITNKGHEPLNDLSVD